jgi:site-specific recombinase XerD
MIQSLGPAIVPSPLLPELWDALGQPNPLPQRLTGHGGVNRQEGPNALGVTDDLAAVRLFLMEYAHSPATLRTYTKEIERLILWAHVAQNKALSDLNRADFAAYSAFLADPQPAQLWCGPRRGRGCTRKSPTWRPFVGPLSPSAQRSALIIINIMMGWLTRAGYLRQNPLGLMRRQSQHALATVDAALQVRQRVFDGEQWRAILQTVHEPTQHDFADAQEAARARFLVALMYFLALRVGELVSHTMGHFRQHQGRWIFYVVGKGRKAAEVPANDSLMDEVRRYRRSLGLQPHPLVHETTPLIANSAQTQALGPRRINQIIKTIVQRAAARIEAKLPHRAAHMRNASAHWFRHTSLTRQAEAGLHFTHIKANARHARLDTTLIYIHTEDQERHRAMQAHTWDQAPDQPPQKD